MMWIQWTIPYYSLLRTVKVACSALLAMLPPSGGSSRDSYFGYRAGRLGAREREREGKKERGKNKKNDRGRRKGGSESFSHASSWLGHPPNLPAISGPTVN